MSNIIPFKYQGRPVRFSTDGWINATDIAKRFGKRPAKWLELPTTKSYMAALAKALGIGDVGKSDIGLVITKKGGPDQGTWLHPKLAVAFGRWLDDDFAVWCDMHIDDVLRGQGSLRHQFDVAVYDLQQQDRRGSTAGRELAQHRWVKPPLVQKVESLREQLQMTLALDQ
ncbi:KilA-N domain-containing protein [Halomonas elongata]|uniref:APSES domain protein n=1 Tax=Halomonas elongata (strain ATCC 33173 / DSM 2581 / NBRC 15536 / NCIMB 2198 / 1H9) TaxID=768066 RepID=E1VAW0_HALED|nr:KilA-N domain-containing protein [Halomonas elongata]WBF17814.1 KilA-N domain-containing protein [Halomonas elongata]WPU46659.1 KilA-N domain-containing protein [Halomonas elongata DSM 2581]CBV44059.2 APSES domain protein [Halomonas elongata DSM 2581]